jgi:DNA-binding IclR family transcriptional regulator
MMLYEKVYAIYDFIAVYKKKRGHAPSQAEIAHGVQMHYTTLMKYLDKMDHMGMIERNPGQVRGIKLIRREANWNALIIK